MSSNKTVVMRPPYYGLTAWQTENLPYLHTPKPAFYEMMPEYTIHPLNLPDASTNTHLSDDLLSYNKKKIIRNCFDITYFQYENAQLMKLANHRDDPVKKYSKYTAEYVTSLQLINKLPEEALEIIHGVFLTDLNNIRTI